MEQVKLFPQQSPHSQVLALLDINTQLHEHVATAHGIADLRLAQNRDTHILALKRLLNKESLPIPYFQWMFGSSRVDIFTKRRITSL